MINLIHHPYKHGPDFKGTEIKLRSTHQWLATTRHFAIAEAQILPEDMGIRPGILTPGAREFPQREQPLTSTTKTSSCGTTPHSGAPDSGVESHLLRRIPVLGIRRLLELRISFSCLSPVR
jgi:hypothetical protein